MRQMILILLVMIFMVGCRQSQQEDVNGTADLAIELLFPLNPTLTDNTEMTFHITDTNGVPVNDATLSLKGDMTHAGMMPVLADVTGGDTGLYTVPFAWSMSGDWILTVRATLPDGTWSEQEFALTVTE